MKVYDVQVGFSGEELKEIREIIWKNTGIYIEDSKMYLLSYKLKIRLGQLGVEPREYMHLLRDSSQKELWELMNVITIGETQFFRDKVQFDLLFDKIVKPYVGKGVKSLNILSAGCATGEEAYTLSIYMLEKIPSIPYKIVGVDINANFIERAKEGLYSSYPLRGVPPYFIQKYFDQIDESTWKIKDIVKKNVTFEKVNLIDNFRMKLLGKFDFIVCKNVIIYFDDDSRDKLAQIFWTILNDGGFLVLGPAERIRAITAIFEPIFMDGLFFYKKQDKLSEL